MKLYLDTEFNGHGRELVSIAIASEDGNDFYAVAPEPRIWDKWVFENVFPHLDREPEPMDLLRKRLQTYLQDREGADIYADWPADFEHLCQIMTGPDYSQSWMCDCSMHLLTSTDPKPDTPHNALSDARALRDWHMALA